MKTRRKACWLLTWDHTRLPEGRGNIRHLRLPEFVGTIPSRFNTRTVERMLPAILLSHAPISAAAVVDYGKSFTQGQPRVERERVMSDGWVTCRLGRLWLRARIVRDLEVVEMDDGKEEISWTEGRVYRIEETIAGEDVVRNEIEITPERKRSLIVEREVRAIV